MSSATRSHEPGEATVVRIDVSQGEHGLFYATSRDISGLFVSAENQDLLKDEILEGVKAIYELKGEKALVMWARAAEDDGWPPVITVPTYVAKAAMSN